MGEGGLHGAVLQQALADVGRTLLGKGCRHDGKRQGNGKRQSERHGTS
jgi:hypothetical protein